MEGTAGNTGIGLAHMCLALGYKCVIYMPNNQSRVGRKITVLAIIIGQFNNFTDDHFVKNWYKVNVYVQESIQLQIKI